MIMTFYSRIYHNICEFGKQRKLAYFSKTSDLHLHHILPKHSGGEDVETNFTYLTIREHIISHYLLWKLNKNINDLRSMKMLGANLTVQQRQLIGKWCFENKIGFHNASKDIKKKWQAKGIKTQIQKEVGIFDSSKRKEYATIGGKASIRSENNPWSYWASKEGRKHRASLGGKSHRGKFCMHKPGDISFIRVEQTDIEQYKNMGYILGSPIKPNTGKKFGPSKNRRKVTDGVTIYESVHEAAQKNSITPSTIIHRCKSKNSTWNYVS